jgi:hypothetical protein
MIAQPAPASATWATRIVVSPAGFPALAFLSFCLVLAAVTLATGVEGMIV